MKIKFKFENEFPSDFFNYVVVGKVLCLETKISPTVTERRALVYPVNNRVKAWIMAHAGGKS